MSTSEENFGRIRRYSIQSLQDRAIPLGMQRAMQEALPCQSVMSINTFHLRAERIGGLFRSSWVSLCV